MALRWIAILVLVLAVGVGYLATLNSTEVDIFLPLVGEFQLTSGLIMIFSLAIGIFGTIIFFALRDWHEYFRKQAEKKRAKLAEIAREKLNKARIFTQLGLSDKAIALAKESIAKNPGLIEAHELLGDLIAQKEDFYGAAARHNQALNLDPGNDVIRWKLAMEYYRGGNAAVAKKYIEEGIGEHDKNAYLVVKYRDLLMEQKDWDGAIGAQHRLSKIKEYKTQEDHRHIIAGLLYEKGKDLLEKKQHDEAAKSLEEAVKMDPQLSAAYAKVGDAYIAQGKDKPALKIWALGYRRTANQAILTRLEDYYLHHDDPSRIINLYLRYIEEEPQDALLRFYFASLLFKLEMLQESQNQIEELRRVQGGDNPRVALLAYRLKMKMDDTPGALNELNHVIDSCQDWKTEYACFSCQKKTLLNKDRCPECGRWGSLREIV